MNSKELKKLVKTLRESGITHYKTAEIELDLKPLDSLPTKPIEKPKPVVISEDEENEIKHKLEELTSVMQLGDMDLLNRLFPDTEQLGEKE